jgi:hypothetical protein
LDAGLHRAASDDPDAADHFDLGVAGVRGASCASRQHGASGGFGVDHVRLAVAAASAWVLTPTVTVV